MLAESAFQDVDLDEIGVVVVLTLADVMTVASIIGDTGVVFCCLTSPMVISMVLKKRNKTHSISLHGNLKIRLHRTHVMHRHKNPRER